MKYCQFNTKQRSKRSVYSNNKILQRSERRGFFLFNNSNLKQRSERRVISHLNNCELKQRSERSQKCYFSMTSVKTA